MQQLQQAATPAATTSSTLSVILSNPSSALPAAVSMLNDGGTQAARMLLPSSVSEPVLQTASFLRWLAVEVRTADWHAF